ncbi:RHS repeat-associated core domain-containing protein [Streptomyces sp. NPDC046237]|uniref:RHS repeat-associated core domain-containing protein n=1 Tax=Streptomyces sp. NPDC046237 TaxID=3154914 RepID=UPI0033F25259
MLFRRGFIVPNFRNSDQRAAKLSRTGIVGILSAALSVSLLTAPAWAAPTEKPGPTPVPKTKSVDGTDYFPTGLRQRPKPPKSWNPPPVTWPAPASQELSLQAGTEDSATVGGVPVRLIPSTLQTKKSAVGPGPGRVEFAVKDRTTARKAGVDGLLMTLRPTDTTASPSSRVGVEVDYAAIRGAYGAGWSSRLRLVTLPACALTTPEKPECRKQTPLATTNDTKNHTLTATLTPGGSAPSPASPAGDAAKATSSISTLAMGAAGATVLAATAGTSGDQGSFKATSLSASGSWNAGGNSGGFGWSVPIDVPAAPGGLAPKVALSYNSSAIDGRTASTNNQASWIGEGWEYSPGFVERHYAACENDKQGGNNTAKTGDLCWKSENATLSLNGSSNELVWDATKSTWKLQRDDGSRIERVYDTTANNSGDADFEYWKVTTLDGTQYWFGKNRLPGWDTETNSVFTVPVYGNHSGEQGHATDYASSAEQQGWRWNLDYVVDPHGNAMALYYTKEQGHYAQNEKRADPKAYTRGGYLNRIDYGLRAGAAYPPNPAGRVTFTTGDRCLSNCTFDEAHATSWPDVPVDLNCTSGTECLQASPTFWSKQRLRTISTFSLVGSTLQPADTWTLNQSFPATGDTSTPTLFLDSVQRTAKAGALADIAMPATTFEGTLMANRVDAAEGRPPLNRKRITKVTNETGGQTLVTYHPTNCTPTALPAPDATTSKRCYPSWWTPDGFADPVKDWFHKYLVSTITEDDTTGGSGSESKTTSYTYSNGPHWRRDTSEFTLDKHRSWNVYRGYGTVRAYTGAVNRVKNVNTYFLGMAGDTLADGSTRTVAAINGITDREDFSGRTASTSTYDVEGDTGKIVAQTTYTPWQSGATATQQVKGITDPDTPGTPAPNLPAKTARLSGTATEKASTLLDNGTGWRTLTTSRNYDSTYGLVTSESDDGAGGSVEARCTVTRYVSPDTTNWLIAYPSEVITSASGICDTRPNAVTSWARSYYDGKAFGAAPTPGKAAVTKGEQLSSYTPELTPVWDTVSESTYDQYGRVLTAKGQDQQTVTTTYEPAAGAQPTTITTTNVKNHTTHATLDGIRGLPLTATDANNRTTTSEYDALGRLTKGWGTGRATTQQPNATFTYNLSSTLPSTVTSKKLYENGTWGTSVTLYDSHLRSRQTQTDAIGTTGRVITDTFYDNHGRAHLTNAPFYNSSAVSTTMLSVTPNQIPQAIQNEYDGRGRVTASIQLSLNVEKWRTTNTYGDYWSASAPPAGGTATLTLTDVRGRTIEQRQYKDRNPLIGAADTQYEKITRSYDEAGRLAKLTDASGHNSWTHSYDLRGRQTATTDPDKGLSTIRYGADGRVETATDARGTTLATTYDALGRKTSLRTGSVTGPKLAEWTYDTATGGLGLPATSTRYDSSITANAAYTTAVTGYDTTGRPTGTKVTIPSVTGEEKLAGTYTIATTATPVSGLPKTAAYSTTNTNATTALPAETVTSHYGAQDMLGIVDGTLNHAYLRGASYTEFGELAQAQLGNLGKIVTQTLTYETSTRRLIKSTTDRELTGPATPSNITYKYDPAGNITGIRDAQDDGAIVDEQCFTYDWARRLSEAWTSGDACATKPVNGSGTPNLGTVDPYWTSWTFTNTGQRATETLHKAGSITADTTRTYTYPTTTGEAQAHGVRSVTAIGGATGIDTYTYDATGNLTKKTPANAGPVQDLTWNEEGKLKTSTTSGAKTSFVYDAENTRIIRRESAATTLYLPGGQELVLAKATSTVTGTRYYAVPGGSAIRTSSDDKVRLLVADHHNTNTLSFSSTTLTFNRRKTLPYGGQRGAVPAFWPGQKGFVGGDIDPTTGLTHIGAREYDTNLGQFISVDPIFEIDQPQSINGYSYADSSPVTKSDPTGLAACRNPDECGGGLNYGNNNPSKDPSKPLNDPSHGCSGCDGDSYNNSGGADGTDLTSSVEYVFISPHFALKYNDPRVPQYMAAWQEALDQVAGGAQPGSEEYVNSDFPAGKHEKAAWYVICRNNSGLCPKGLGATLSTSLMMDGAREFGIAVVPLLGQKRSGARTFGGVLTNNQVKQVAEFIGYVPAGNQKVKKQQVFEIVKRTSGMPRFIVQDIGSGDGNGSHNGGLFKGAKTVAGLAKKETRMGTYALSAQPRPVGGEGLFVAEPGLMKIGD